MKTHLDRSKRRQTTTTHIKAVPAEMHATAEVVSVNVYNRNKNVFDWLRKFTSLQKTINTITIELKSDQLQKTSKTTKS